VVNQHFGRARQFFILEGDSETYTYRLAEIRSASPVCQGGDHQEDAMEQAVKALSDCDCLLVSRIGYRAQHACEAQGISVYEIPDEIGKAVERLLKYRAVQNLFIPE
jgi:predicted Fe-Mo cluster-binding NifX family protein